MFNGVEKYILMITLRQFIVYHFHLMYAFIHMYITIYSKRERKTRNTPEWYI